MDLVKIPEKSGADNVAIFVRQLGSTNAAARREETDTTIRVPLSFLLIPHKGTERIAAERHEVT